MEIAPPADDQPVRESTLRTLVGAAIRPPALVVVSGEQGIGKTHLTGLLLADPALESHTRLVGRCLDLRERLPLLPVLDALAAWSPPAHTLLPPPTGGLHALLPELGPHLPPARSDGLPANACTVRALRALLEAMGPTVLVLEDLQWADTTTVDFLHHLLAHPPRHLTLIVTHRDDPVHAPVLRALLARTDTGWHRAEHRVPALDLGELADLATRRLGGQALAQDFVRALHRHTAGIPQALEDLLDHLATERAAPTAPPRARFDVPDRLRERVLAAVEQLDPDARAIVEAAAVAAAPVTTGDLAAIAGLPLAVAERAARTAHDHAVLHPGTGASYRLRHPLAEQAVRQQLPAHRRQALNLRAARTLLDHSPRTLPLDRIARHYQHAGRPAQWLLYAEAAADRATRHAEHDEAAELLLDALQAAPTARQRIRLALKLGRAALHARNGHNAIDALHHVLAHDDPAPAARGELRLARGILMRNQGHGTAGLDEIAAAVPDLTTRPDLTGRAMAAVSLPSTTGWPLADHVEWMERAHRLSLHTPDPALRLATAANRAATLMFTADPHAWQAADALASGAATCPERLEIARGNVNLAHAANLLGHPQRAGVFLARAKTALDHNHTYLTGHAETAQLLLDWATGRWHTLDTRAHGIATDYADIPDLLAECLLVQGLHALATRGNLTTARHLLHLAADTTRFDTGTVLPASAAALARIETTAAHFAQAIETTTPTLTQLRRTGAWMWATDIAPTTVEAQIRAGHTGAATDLVQEFADGIAGRDAPAAHAALTTCRALLAEGDHQHDEAATTYEQAAHTWHGINRPYESARALEAQGALLLALGSKNARPVLSRALEGYARLGATWDAARTRHTMRKAGIVLTHRRGPHGYGTALSPREREVTQLAAAGYTNQQIAHALHLSPRTVEHHVAKALSKLNLHSRNELPKA